MMASKENIFEEEGKQAGLHYARLSNLISELGMRTLRLKFRDRYKLMTKMDWENGSVNLNEDFIKRTGSTPDLTMEQKKALESAEINNWDFTLLVNIVLSLGPDIAESNYQVDPNVYAEDEALKLLRNVRNYLEQEPRQGIQNTEFGLELQVAKVALLRLGAREKDTEQFLMAWKLVPLESDTAALIDEENEGRSKALQNRAEKLLASGELEGAIQLFSEALLLSCLSNGEKSCIYSSRSQAYITHLEEHRSTLETDIFQKYLDVAMDDANLVIKLQPKCWNGHLLEGKCYHLQKLYKEAVDSFETALSSNPGSEEIINAMDVCRLDKAIVEGDIVFGALSTPNSHSDGIQNKEETLRLIETNELLMRSSRSGIRARGCVFMGRRHLNGEEVPLDQKKAVELFQEAAEAGSPDGAHNAGLCYLRGIGAKQNIPEAVKYFEAAASQQVKSGVVHVFDLLGNEAIAKSKAMLGAMYRNGVGTPRNYARAAKLFSESAEEANGIAAMSLAEMLAGGIGIPMDLKRALQYQKLAVELGSCSEAILGLARLLAQAGELTQARCWYDRAITSGLADSDSGRRDFENLLQRRQQQFDEFKKKLPAHVLNSEVPIQLLYNRHLKRHRADPVELMKVLRKASEFCSSSVSGGSVRNELVVHFKIAEMETLALQGQEYARILLDALKILQKGVETIGLLADLDSVTDEASMLRKQELKKLAMAEVAAFHMTDVGHAATITADCRLKLVEIGMEFINDRERSEFDLHARVCRLNLGMKSFEETLKFAKACMSLYPEQPHFYVVQAKMLGCLLKYEDGARVVEEGLKVSPGNVELLFYGASFSYGAIKAEAVRDRSIQIEAFQEFIRKAPSGHRNLPEAYYLIANLYASEGKFEDFGDYYSLGVEAEKTLLSSFLPYDSNSKKSAEQCIELIQEVNIAKSTCSPSVLSRLLDEDPQEVEENQNLKLTNPKRIVTVKECRSRLASWELRKLGGKVLGLPLLPFRTALEGQQKQRAPTRPRMLTLKPIRFVDMDPTIDQVYEDRFIDLTIMEEYIDWISDCIHSVVKDDNDDFNVICFYNFDRSQPSTQQKLGFGSRIQLMHPYLVPQPAGGPAVRVDDSKSVVLLSSGGENPICRYCWKPNPGSRCSKCRKSKYCNKECQKLDWDVLGHRELCKIIRKSQDELSAINVGGLEISEA